MNKVYDEQGGLVSDTISLSVSSSGSAVFGSGADHPRWRTIQHKQGRCLIVSNMMTV